MTPDDFPLTAIYAETGPHLRAHSAAITLRIWHHLASDEARLLLFEPFRTRGQPYPLLDAVLMTAADSAVSFATHLDAIQIRDGQQALGDAFAAALTEILGETHGAPVTLAWRKMLDHLLDRISTRIEQRRA